MLGEGSYGRVYKAFDSVTGQLVAVKICTLHAATSKREGGGEDRGARERQLLNEVQILQRCQSPYVTRYRDAHLLTERRRSDRFWIVMEYCDRGSLQNLVQVACEKDGRTGSLQELTVTLIATFILLGLEFLHSKNIIHRDLKGGNVLLTSEGGVKIADFGVSRQLDSSASFAQTMVGTPAYTAPEVLLSFKAESSSHYDSKVDIWSLGILLITMCESELPVKFNAPIVAILQIPKMEAPMLRQPASRSASMNALVAHCLRKDPCDRPSAAELLDNYPFLTHAVRALQPNRAAAAAATAAMGNVNIRQDDELMSPVTSDDCDGNENSVLGGMSSPSTSPVRRHSLGVKGGSGRTRTASASAASSSRSSPVFRTHVKSPSLSNPSALDDDARTAITTSTHHEGQCEHLAEIFRYYELDPHAAGADIRYE